MKNQLLLLSITILIFVGCGKGDEDLKEKTIIQTNEEIKSRNENLISWSTKLQDDLNQRRRFINSIAGEYEGSFQVSDYVYTTRLVIVPTIPEYDSTRVRTLEELEYELQNLNLNIEVSSANKDGFNSLGCVFEDIKPDIKKGYMFIGSEECVINYHFYLSYSDNREVAENVSKNLSKAVRAGSIDIIDEVFLKRRSKFNHETFIYSLRRVE